MKSPHELRKELAGLQTKLQGWVSAVYELADGAVAVTREGDPKKIATRNQAFLAAKFQQEVHEKAIAVVEAELAEAERRERQEARKALAPEAEKLVERVEKAHSDVAAAMNMLAAAVRAAHEVESEASRIASQGGTRHRYTLQRDHGWVLDAVKNTLSGRAVTTMPRDRQLSAISQLVEALAGGAA